MSDPRAYINGKWVKPNTWFWDGVRWSPSGSSSTAVARKPSVWGDKIKDWINPDTELGTPTAQLTLTPSDNIREALSEVMWAAAAVPGGSPRTRRGRLILTPGVYNQHIPIDRGIGSLEQRVGWEMVGSSGNPADVVIQPGENIGGNSTFEHGFQTYLMSGITFRRPLGLGDGQVMHAAEQSGAQEHIMHNLVIDHLRPDGGSLSWGVKGIHDTYIADTTLRGNVYMHSMFDTRVPTQNPIHITFDNVESDWNGLYGVADESIHPDDMVVIRSGWHARGSFGIGFQKEGTPERPCFSAVIDPASGISTTNSNRVYFRVPDVASRPILDENVRMKAYYGTD